MIRRILERKILERMFQGKAILLFGSRQSGKTTMIRHLQETLGEPSVFINCDDPSSQSLLQDITVQRWKQIIGGARVVFIDEAQRIENIGIKLKLVTDELPQVQLIVTGSSSFELANRTNEPLTGRKWEFHLFPISWYELTEWAGFPASRGQLDQRLIYGMYPEIITKGSSSPELLNLLSRSLLYKDLLQYQGIRKPQLLEDLLRALALQLGNEVSMNELAVLLRVDKQTVASYIQLLEQAFIIFRLRPLSRNLRNEISSKNKIYFYDNGIRNSLIAAFNPLDLRQDKGALWENFLVSERLKRNHYGAHWLNSYFWRTHAQQEIDYVEEYDGRFHPYEFKFGNDRKAKLPEAFQDAYMISDFQCIHPGNFEEFLGIGES
jgi:predicted AAA+ superfamily ATPase